MLYIILALFALLVGIVVLLYIYRLEPLCNNKEWNCDLGTIQEKYYDTSILKPTLTLGLGYLTYDPNVNNAPMCNPMWYAIRYVRVSDGGYGPLTDWLGPIAAGANNLPCIGNNVISCTSCQNAGIPSGQSSSAANIMRIFGMGTPDYDLSQDSYFVNVHRQVGYLDTSSEGTIVGLLLPGILPSTNTNALMYTEAGEITLDNNGNICSVTGTCNNN